MAITMTKDVVFKFDSISVKDLIESCEEHAKNGCKFCGLNTEKQGCYFRQGRVPREWSSKE